MAHSASRRFGLFSELHKSDESEGLSSNNQLMVNWWFGFLRSPCKRDCYLKVSLESHTTGP